MSKSKNFETLGQVLAYWAQIQPESKAYTMLDANGVEQNDITYGQMYSQAINIAKALLSYGLQSRNVILLYPPGIEFIVAFFGCLYAGVVPAPIHPPKRNRSNQKIANLVMATDAAAILVPSSQKETFRDILIKEENWPQELIYIATDQLTDLSTSCATKLPQVDGSKLAFLQFTSGSTSLPKGVMISHSNCLSNLEMIVSESQANPSSTFVTWLPQHHDLGLVAHLLHSLYSGSHCVMLAPTTFVSQPIQWLRAISKYRGEYTGAPNFAYQLCVDKISTDEQEDLDLSSLRVAINAAEPINSETFWDFSNKFARNGFKPQMFIPAYGMAEATVFISCGFVQKESVFKTVDSMTLSRDNLAQDVTDGAQKKVLVGCGHAKLSEQIKIVDPELNCEVRPNHVGEVWVSGPNVMCGYYKNPEATTNTLVYLEGDDRLYLRTGDLGFMDTDGELYITGRVKDMIIVNGVNYYPQDLEGCVEQAHPDIRSGCAIAFSVPGKIGEELVIVTELNKAAIRKIRQSSYLEELAEAICSRIGENFELFVHQIVFLKIGQIPKTSSGKLRRQQCKQEFLQGYPSALVKWIRDQSKDQSSANYIDSSNIEQTFTQIMSMGSTHLKVFNNLIQMLMNEHGVKLVDFNIEKPISVYGIDTPKLIKMHSQLQEQLSCQIPRETFFQENNCKGMLNDIVHSLSHHN